MNKIKYLIMFCVLFVFFTKNAFCDDDDYSTYLEEMKSLSNKECIAYSNNQGVLGTAEKRVMQSAVDHCFEKNMVIELDKYLMKLKKTNKELFSKEMASQKYFNFAVKGLCESITTVEDSTGSFPVSSKCYREFYDYRLKQAKFFNNGASIYNKNLKNKISNIKYFSNDTNIKLCIGEICADKLKEPLDNFKEFANKSCDSNIIEDNLTCVTSLELDINNILTKINSSL